MIKTSRLLLRRWRPGDRNSFAALHADPEVMLDLGGPLDRAASDRKFDRYVAAFEQHGYSRWVLENCAGHFLGYTGIMPSDLRHPLGLHSEIGWRLARSAWGNGYAAEAAAAALDDAFERHILDEVLAYTAPDNARSIAVMNRLGLQRDQSRDFVLSNGWRGLVWVAAAADWGAHPLPVRSTRHKRRPTSLAP